MSNTGPLLHLSEAQALSLLQQVGQVNVPKAVQSEIVYHNPSWRTQWPDWIERRSLTEAYQEQAVAWYQAGLLDPGEAEALALSKQLGADWFVTDDSAARLMAQDHGLEVHGSLGIVLWSAATGQLSLPEADAVLDHLQDSSMWISPAVLSEARSALQQM